METYHKQPAESSRTRENLHNLGCITMRIVQLTLEQHRGWGTMLPPPVKICICKFLLPRNFTNRLSRDHFPCSARAGMISATQHFKWIFAQMVALKLLQQYGLCSYDLILRLHIRFHFSQLWMMPCMVY